LRKVWSVLRRESQYGPAYHLLLHSWMRLTGCHALLALKSWNILFDVLTAICLYLLTRRGLSIPTAVTAVLLLAFSSCGIPLRLQLKCYALSCLCVAAGTLVLSLMMDPERRGERRWWLLYALFLGVGLLTHPYFAMVLPLHGLYVIAQGRLSPGRYLPWVKAL